MAVPDPVATYERKFSLYAVIGAVVWLVFLAPVVREGWRERDALVGWVGLVSTFAFAGAYIWSFVWGRPKRRSGELWHRVDGTASFIYVTLLALAVVMTLSLHSTGLGSAVYVAVAGVMLFPVRLAVVLAIVLGGGAEFLARTIPGWDGANGIALSVGLATFGLWDLAGNAPQPGPRRGSRGERPAGDRSGAVSDGPRPS